MILRAALLVLGMLMVGSAAWSSGQQVQQPTPPTAAPPSMEPSSHPLLCVGCEGRFTGSSHEEMLERLAKNEYFGQLRKALYFQDSILQFSSKAHFDNCDFDNAFLYLAEIQLKIDAAARASTVAQDRGESDASRMEALNAFYAIGQALHAIQDFFAHSNFVELATSGETSLAQIEQVALWTSKGQQRVNDLRSRGLVSGYVFWGFPQRCPKGTPSHSAIAKDSPTTESGRKVVPGLGSNTQYKVARYLAEKASAAFLVDTFSKWPVLRAKNGDWVALEVMVDHRGL